MEVVTEFGLPEYLQIIYNKSLRSILITYKCHRFYGKSYNFVS